MDQEQYIIDNPPRHTPTLKTETYQVEVNTQLKNEGKITNTTVSYSLEINFIDTELIEIKKNKIMVNNSLVTNTINELYIQTATPLHQLSLRCTKTGNVKKLYKYDKLIQRWEETQELVRASFKGQLVDQIIEQLNKVYTNYETLIQAINKDEILQLFYRSFINDYLIYYGTNNSNYTNISILKNIPLFFRRYATLGLQGKALLLKADYDLQYSKLDISALQDYFGIKKEDWNRENLTITMEDHILLDYDTLWIQEAKTTETIRVANQEKRKTVTVKKI